MTPAQTNFPKPAPIPSIPTPRIRGVIQKNPAAPAEAVTPPPRPNDLPES
jgi:hypothetical protein